MLTAASDPRSRRHAWSLTVTQKAGAALGLLVLALLVMGWGLYASLHAAERSMAHVIHTTVPATAVSLEMANVISEASLKVESYVRRPNHDLRQGAIEDFGRFESVLQRHAELAATDEARLFGTAATSLFGEYRGRGLGLMAMADDWHAHLHKTTELLRRFDEMIAVELIGEMKRRANAPVARRVAAHALKTQAIEVALTVGRYNDGEGDTAPRALVKGKFTDFEESLNNVATLSGSDDERRVAGLLATRWAELREAFELGMLLRDQSERDLVHFRWLRGLLKRIDQGMQREAESQRTAAFATVRGNQDRASLALAWGLALAVLSAAASYVWIGRTVRRPLQALNRGARAVANGRLDVRLPGSGNPDFDQVLDGFNRMAERLEQTTVSKARLEESEQRFNHAVRGSQAGIWDWNMATDTYYVSPRLEQMLGYDEDELPTERELLIELIHPDDRALISAAVAGHFERRLPYDIQFRIRRKDGRYGWFRDIGSAVWDEAGRVLRFSGSISDIDAQKQAEAQIERLAYYDALTDLPGRALFADRLRQAMIDARRHQRHVGVVFIDLDRFKAVNDEFGHAAGDALLRGVAMRLQACVRAGDTVGRFSGDEFGAVLADIGQAADIAHLAQKFVAAFAEPFVVEGHECFVTPSIGISTFPIDGADEPALLRAADVAMYRTKKEGGNNYQFFTADMTARAHDRLALENALRHAVDRDELRLHYQPVVTPAGRIVGVEALLRWFHPERGVISPADFIPLAEETGLIVPIGDWVLRTACGQLREWQSLGHDGLMLAVNLSIRQLRQRDWARSAAEIIASAGIDPATVELEITESVLAEDRACVDALREISATGVRLSIDDFGTGYSSLAYLKRLPVDTLKIDQSFVRGIPGSAVDSAIVTAIMAMARSLGLHLIAEGVENEAQLDFLRKHGCEAMQGYHFGRPVPAHELAVALSTDARRSAPLVVPVD